MANQGAKRQVETNRRKLQFLQQLIFIATVCTASDGLPESTASGDFLAPAVVLAIAVAILRTCSSGYLCAWTPSHFLQIVWHPALCPSDPW